MHGGCDIVDPIRAAFRARIGADRHDVWFGGTTRVVAERDAEGGLVVTLVAGTPLTHGLIHRTFRADFAAAVREALGEGGIRIEVIPDEADARSDAQAATVGTDLDGARTGEPPVPPGPPARRPGAAPPQSSGRAGGETTVPGDSAVRALVPWKEPSGEFRPLPASRAATVRAAGEATGSRALVPEPPPPGRVPLTLDAYVVGPGNRMAHVAASMAAERPGAMSPLLLHGPSGVGKTHLLDGIGRRAREHHSRAAVVTVSAEQFTTTFLEALHGRRGLPGFRRSLRSADLLLIDDVHFLVGKKATVSEVLHTIDALHRLGKQVVLSADRDVDGLSELGEELQTRLRGGMAVRILPPDEPTRCGIVTALGQRRGLALPEDVVRFVAARMTRDTRELAGAVNRLEATAAMLAIPIDLPMARECLADLVRSSTRAVRLADVERAVCHAFGVEAAVLHSSCRARRVNHPRVLAMFLARKHTHAPLAEIGRHFGRRSHSTVIAATRTVDGWIASGTRLTLADAEWGVEEALRRVEEALRVG